MTEIPNPLYNPWGPSDLAIYRMQSVNPLNYLSPALFPRSTPNLVLAKSRGYTKVRDIDPAMPPETNEPTKNLALSFLGS